MNTARSRQLPLASFRVRTGSWVPFSCRALCLKVRLMVCVMSDEKLVSVGRSVRAQKLGGPAIERWVRGSRRDEAGETWPVFRWVGKRMGTGKVLDIGGSEADRRVVEMNGAFEAKLAGSLRETGGRDMIAVDIPRPAQLARLGRDFELGFEHFLIVVVARTQHHPVLAERDRSLIVIGRDVPDGENRHCGPTIMQVPLTCIFRARNSVRISTIPWFLHKPERR